MEVFDVLQQLEGVDVPEEDAIWGLMFNKGVQLEGFDVP